MATILIDGFNLGLEKGTGVATYARNLSYEIKTLGHSVSVLYGNRSAPSRDRLLQEIAFFDSNVGNSNRAIEIAEQVYRAILGPLQHRARKVPITGGVISRAFDARMPAYDTILNSADVFKRSHSAFMLWGSLSRISVPEKPTVAHWTYPLP